MSVLKICLGAVGLTLALSSGLKADVSVSEANDPASMVGDHLGRLLEDERANADPAAGPGRTDPTALVGLVAAARPDGGLAPGLRLPVTQRGTPRAAVSRARPAAWRPGLVPVLNPDLSPRLSPALAQRLPARVAANQPARPTRSAAWNARATAGTIPRVTDPMWLAAQPDPKGGKQFECLARALYFEARGEGTEGQVAVAEVILNRVDGPGYPDSVCAVVNQRNARGCQFSFTCDGQKDVIAEKAAWERSERVARAMLDGAPRVLTAGATYFHTPAVKPSWSRKFTRTTQIGRHIFYRPPLQVAGDLVPRRIVELSADAAATEGGNARLTEVTRWRRKAD